MADGTDKAHALRVGRSHLQECAYCAAKPLGQHACAFLTGTFADTNWNCGAFAAAAEAESCGVVGDEVEVCMREAPTGAVLLWIRRVGQPQRVRHASVILANLQQVPATLELMEQFYDPVLKWASVFATAVVLDVIWALYIRRTASGKAVSAGIYAAVIMLLGAYNTLSFIEQPMLVFPIAFGAWLGTYSIVRWEHRGAAK